jgi:hypothetical protein
LVYAADKKYIIAMKSTATTTVLFRVIIAIIVAAAGVRAQDDGNDGYGFLMLEEPVSPRNVAMGSAGTALGGYGFRYYNPVQPFFLPSAPYYASAEFGRMPGGVNRGGIETAALFPEWFSAVSFFSSAVDFRTSDEKGLGPLASSATTVGALSVGYIRDNVAAGAGLSMVDDRIWAANGYSAFALSFGLGYKLFDGKLGIGAAWMNAAAWSRGFAGDGPNWRGGRVPSFARAGAAWTDTLWSLPYTVAADLAYRDEDGTLGAPVGLEVKALPYISLRIGKRFGWETEIMSLGIGFNIDRLSFDAAFTPTVFVDDYEMKWSMGFTYGIGGGGRRKPAEIEEEEVAPVKESVSTEKPALTDEESVSTEESALTDEAVSEKEESAPTDETSVSTEEEPVPVDEAVPAENLVHPAFPK